MFPVCRQWEWGTERDNKQDEQNKREDAAARRALVLDLAATARAARDDDLDGAAVVRARHARDGLVRAADDVHRRRRALAAVALGAVRVVHRDTLVRRHVALFCSHTHPRSTHRP